MYRITPPSVRSPKWVRGLALLSPREIIAPHRTDAVPPRLLRPGGATNPDSLTMVTHVVAIELATAAHFNEPWNGRIEPTVDSESRGSP